MDHLGSTSRYWYRDLIRLPDPFEPALIREALLCKARNSSALDVRKPVSLGLLVFGQKTWPLVLDSCQQEMGPMGDPLSTMFMGAGKFYPASSSSPLPNCDQGLMRSPSHLDLPRYGTLDPGIPPKQWPVQQIYCYPTSERTIWSIVPAFPPRSLPKAIPVRVKAKSGVPVLCVCCSLLLVIILTSLV
jgi:hypothetical protein